jgi:hypothetical protein
MLDFQLLNCCIAVIGWYHPVLLKSWTNGRLFLNGTCGYMVREMHRRREMTRFNLVGDRFAIIYVILVSNHTP